MAKPPAKTARTHTRRRRPATPAPAAGTLDAILGRLAASSDPLVKQWAERLRHGDGDRQAPQPAGRPTAGRKAVRS